MRELINKDECWCGSGKKYKECHFTIDEKLSKMEGEGLIAPPREIIKTSEQIEGIRKSSQVTKKVLDMVAERIRAGITTDEINTLVHEYTLELGGIPATLNYRGYPKSVCVSINEVVCHGIPDERVLKEGDIVNVDVTTIYKGYYGDSSRMFIIGKASEKAIRLVETAKECLYAGINVVKPFATFGDIGHAIQTHAEEKGYSVVREYGGHGIGIQFHEEPFVDHCAEPHTGMIMIPGMTFTIEPMINEGTYRCKVLRDGWTAVTADGKLTAQWEHTVLVTEEGVEILTA
ncbi:methionine aminopeptidase [Clostridium homopropionicum DSM 5847]|uniref:Methionine aminopeptidase n=1 Tax=Clostridium homopropionicum DSM 5847 TaxID=1121318 RepID=A0A0L6ZES8_9CLOT|nr:type I methionyl aminopeptidase [Clostridium homopropionicum]KOA21480.1 methionine aminopeptidase [Clostridium homopropionicum DSM 5847]SFG08360.1 methionine aminopeptidase, type I [Clostridium homopropionicum]